MSPVHLPYISLSRWEKFFWFVSSENYIVVGGRDAQQNEQLVRTHLSPGDVYVHADVEGASCVVIKNNHATRPVPPLTLAQAGSTSPAYLP